MSADRDMRSPAQQAVDVCLLPARVAGPRYGRSVASWWRDLAAGRIPAPVKLGGRTLWRADELRRWAEAGCPDRRTWEAVHRRGRGDHE